MPPGHPYDFLDTKHALYKLWLTTWRMNERRAFGQVWKDLMPFAGESPERLEWRQSRASYVNFMGAHAGKVTGQLRAQGAPTPDNGRFSFGALGKVRPVSEAREADADFGELIYYSVDSSGLEGSEWPAYWDAVDERSQHVGHRVMMVEIPPARPVRRQSPTQVEEPGITRTEFLAGRKPYALEFSPTSLQMWAKRHGIPEFFILRVPQETGRVEDGKWVEPAQVDNEGNGLGYYLLVRRGCTLLGPQFERGGYWLFTPEKQLLRTGIWNPRGRGLIPCWYHYGEMSRGTPEMPSESRSQTEGLGRVGVSLMDCMSARDWDAFDAARSGKWFNGATPEVMAAIKTQWDAFNFHIGIPPAFDEISGQATQVTMTDDSAGAVASSVFQAIIDSKFMEAKEQSFQAITALPGSSGASKEAGFAEVKAPFLSRRAALRQQSEQNAVRFFEERMGWDPQGFAVYERDYNLTALEDDINAAFEMLRLNQMRSPTLEPAMALVALKQRLGGLPRPPVETAAGAVVEPLTEEQYELQVYGELQQSAEQAQTSAAQATALTTTFTEE